MSRPARARCPTCRSPVPVAPEERPKDYPFCSGRCRLVDLHRWLDGTYAVPGEPAPVEGAPPGPGGAPAEGEAGPS